MDSLDNNKIDIEAFFSSGGKLSEVSSRFELRDDQIKMAMAVSRSFEKGYHLAVEAGTGTGKSFAYLVPAIDFAVNNNCKIVISTHTINLQEQLINKDLPLLAKAVDGSFKAVLAKGRGNYLCQRRLKYTLDNSRSLFEEADINLRDIRTWSLETKDGTLSSIPTTPRGDIWDTIKSEHGNCSGRRCPYYNQCFYWKARRSLETADIIVANHALLFSDLSMKAAGLGVLPDYDAVIIDEAHNIEHVAEEHFGINLSSWTISYVLRSLYNDKTHKGLLAGKNIEDVVELMDQVKEQSKLFFEQVGQWYQDNYSSTNGRCYPGFVNDSLSESIRKLRLAVSRRIKDDADDIEAGDYQLEIQRNVDRLHEVEENIKAFVNQPQQEDNEYIYWVEVSGSNFSRRYYLRSAPIEAGKDIKNCLFDRFNSVILTSATLSCGSDDQEFKFFASRVGLSDYNTLILGSPFDYYNQVTMYVEAGLPEPNSPDFQERAIEAIEKYLMQTEGKAFVLFTSYTMLRAFADQMAPWLAENGFTLLEQGSGISRSELLSEFVEDTNSVLFGTDSFWQGVDVPGEALSNVIILRLPFAVPNHPLIQGKIEKIRKAGGNPFVQYQLPSAIIKFKQGFGRLIRNRLDTGIVAVLDSRVVTKYYGKKFISSIPQCRVEIVRPEFY
ncbi:MAG: ATP-dependent DNA helicase [Sedimentisphaeraceae bacterium JB056]